jgi:hypothetical protein
MAPRYRIVSADGHEAAERLLNETVGSTTELVHSHVHTAREERDGEQDNVMLEMPVTRFTFILRSE